MSLDSQGKHYPQNPNKFEFDTEVTKVFDSMAVRSIPNYDESHNVHIEMFKHLIAEERVILDIGASTGKLFREIKRILGVTAAERGAECIALDPSAPMLDRLSFEHPYVQRVNTGIPSSYQLERKADLVFLLYVLQFIYPDQREDAVEWVANNTAPGGVVVIGEKNFMPDLLVEKASKELYYRFRRGNGYSIEEIEAKTAALANSMWTYSLEQSKELFTSRGFTVIDTLRWLQFGTFIAIKDR
jgi:tRNA (cmo5U34)-methyltransferase